MDSEVLIENPEIGFLHREIKQHGWIGACNPVMGNLKDEV